MVLTANSRRLAGLVLYLSEELRRAGAEQCEAGRDDEQGRHAAFHARRERRRSPGGSEQSRESGGRNKPYRRSTGKRDAAVRNKVKAIAMIMPPLRFDRSDRVAQLGAITARPGDAHRIRVAWWLMFEKKPTGNPHW